MTASDPAPAILGPISGQRSAEYLRLTSPASPVGSREVRALPMLRDRRGTKRPAYSQVRPGVRPDCARQTALNSIPRQRSAPIDRLWSVLEVCGATALGSNRRNYRPGPTA